ncbi:MAG: flagellar motor switch protein FliM [Hydrogenophilaceae bacterium]|nr:flagellar motor switch protein FliM [Hydrogenophilaceae bacterium]
MEEDKEFLSQDEVDALLGGIGDAGMDADSSSTAAGNIRPYDPTSRQFLTETRLPVLENINEKFSRALRTAISEFLKTHCELTISPVRIMKYAELVHGIPAITGISVFGLAPLVGTGALFIDQSTTAVFIDCLFGGGGRASKEIASREYTPIEVRVVEKVSVLILECYQKFWADVHPVDFSYQKTETEKQFVSICWPDDPVIMLSINIKINQSGGEVLVCMPYSAFEPILPLLGRATDEEKASVDRNWLRLLSAQVQSAEIELNANLGTATIPLRQIMEMKPGDFIPISVPNTVSAMVDGFPLMECNFGISNGQYSLRVERIIPQNQQETSYGSHNGKR